VKIGINATFLHDKPTGLGVFTHEVSRALSGAKAAVLVFSPLSLEGIPDDSLFRVPYAIRGSMRFRHNLCRALYLNTILPARCRQRNVDALFCPMMEFPFVPGVPLVVHVHDLHPIQFASQFGRAAVFMRFSLRLMEKSVKRVTVSSDYVKKELLKATSLREGKIDVVPLAYNRTLFQPGGQEEKNDFLRKYSLQGKYILFVGNLFPYKNITTLVEAFFRIRDRISHCLVIVGRKEFFSGPLPQDERIRYMDYVPDEDLPRFYSFADMLVHPSLSEGFGLTPLEAMACGTPVLSSNRGSLPEVVGDAGILFDPLDGPALSELLLSVLRNEALRRELIEKGFRKAEQFSWDKTAAGILSSCEMALKETE
jgi:glycosyltransferase involved in cell wall biosynthesis